MKQFAVKALALGIIVAVGPAGAEPSAVTAVDPEIMIRVSTGPLDVPLGRPAEGCGDPKWDATYLRPVLDPVPGLKSALYYQITVRFCWDNGPVTYFGPFGDGSADFTWEYIGDDESPYVDPDGAYASFTGVGHFRRCLVGCDYIDITCHAAVTGTGGRSGSCS